MMRIREPSSARLARIGSPTLETGVAGWNSILTARIIFYPTGQLDRSPNRERNRPIEPPGLNRHRSISGPPVEMSGPFREDAQDEDAHDTSRCDARARCRRLRACSRLGGTWPWRPRRPWLARRRPLARGRRSLAWRPRLARRPWLAWQLARPSRLGRAPLGLGRMVGPRREHGGYGRRCWSPAYGYYPCRYRWGY